MGLSTEQLAEKIFIRAFPGQSEAMKRLYRYEIESWIAETMQLLGQEALNAKDYQLFQRTRTIPIFSKFGSLKRADFCVFGGDGANEPIISNEGYLVGNTNDYAISHEDILRTGGDFPIVNRVIQFRKGGSSNDELMVGLIRHPFDGDITDPNEYAVCIVIDGTGADVYHHQGDFEAAAFSDVQQGDYFHIKFAGDSTLTIEHYGPSLEVKSIFTPTGSTFEDTIAVAAVFFTDNAKISMPRIGDPNGVPDDGVFRVPLADCLPFIHASIWNKGYVAFDQAALKLLTYTPNQSIRALGGRCDTWYFTLEGDDLLIFAGAATPAQELPADSIRVTGNIVPSPQDLPLHYHERAIEIGVEIARIRVATMPGKITDKK